jgi:rubrerythrin
MSDAATIILVTMFFVFGFPMIFLIFYFAKVHKPLEKARIETPREVFVKEIVMVPCQYCRGLMRETDTQCPHCKAPRKQ